MPTSTSAREKKVLVLVGLLAAAAGANCGEAPSPTSETTPSFSVTAQPLVGNNVLVPTKDTTLLGGILENLNLGSLPFLLVERSLIAFDQQALKKATLGGMQVSSARLEVQILGNPVLSGRARNIQLFRLTHAWEEDGATWKCADDGNIFNLRNNCPAGQEWFVGTPPPKGKTNPWAATPSATAQLRAGAGGVLSFDVTADVKAFAAGTLPNHGWIIKSDDLGGGVLILGA